MKPFNRERFLLWMLAGIFTWQAAIFTGAVIGCFRAGSRDACPNLGDRYESTVNVMVATTLALLTGGAVLGSTQRRSSSSNDRDASASQLPLQLQQPSPGSSSQASPQGYLQSSGGALQISRGGLRRKLRNNRGRRLRRWSIRNFAFYFHATWQVDGDLCHAINLYVPMFSA